MARKSAHVSVPAPALTSADLTTLSYVRTLFEVFNRAMEHVLLVQSDRQSAKAVWGGDGDTPQVPLPAPQMPPARKPGMQAPRVWATAQDRSPKPQRRIDDPGFGLPAKQQTRVALQADYAPSRGRRKRQRHALMVYWPKDYRRRPELPDKQQDVYDILVRASDHLDVETIASRAQRPAAATRQDLNRLVKAKLLNRAVEAVR